MDNGEPKMGNVITDVGIDLDGVIYPFMSAFRTYCAERMGKLFLPDPTHWLFYEDWDLDKETFDQWLNDAARTHDVFASENPYEGVVEAWEMMRSMGLNIHVVTARPQSAWEQTAGWLTEHNLVADSLHFNPTKSFLSFLSKGKAALLDDHIAYYEEASRSGIVPVLMDRPWNQSKTNAIRVTNLTQFVAFINGYNFIAKQEEKKKNMEQFVNQPHNPYVSPFTKKQPHVDKKWWEPHHGYNA